MPAYDRYRFKDEQKKYTRGIAVIIGIGAVLQLSALATSTSMMTIFAFDKYEMAFGMAEMCLKELNTNNKECVKYKNWVESHHYGNVFNGPEDKDITSLETAGSVYFACGFVALFSAICSLVLTLRNRPTGTKIPYYIIFASSIVTLSGWSYWQQRIKKVNILYSTRHMDVSITCYIIANIFYPIAFLSGYVTIKKPPQVNPTRFEMVDMTNEF